MLFCWFKQITLGTYKFHMPKHMEDINGGHQRWQEVNSRNRTSSNTKIQAQSYNLIADSDSRVVSSGIMKTEK